MSAIKSFFLKNYIRLIVAFAIGLILMVVYNLSYQFGHSVNAWANLSYYRDGAFIAGMVIFFIGLLAIISQFGAFDIFSFYAGRKRKEDGTKENYTEYVERKRESRTHFNLGFLSYFIISTCFLIFSFVIYFLLPH
jgi:hypothetical protein